MDITITAAIAVLTVCTILLFYVIDIDEDKTTAFWLLAGVVVLTILALS